MPFQGYGGPRGGGPRNYRQYDDSQGGPEQFRKLFVGGLSYDTDEKGLRAHFEQYGEITDCIVMKDATTKKSRGFGFITFKEASQLDEAQKNRPHKIDGREVETKRAMPRDDPTGVNQQTVKKMFVGGLKDDTTEEMIREAFSGKIENVEMIKDKATGKSRGFCFVEFDDYDTVDKHVLKKYFELNGRRVEVKKAVSRNEMPFGNAGRGFGRGEFYGPSYGGGPGYSMGGGGYGPGPAGPARGGYGGGNYGPSYGANQGWNQGGYGDYGYSNQGKGNGNWGNNYYGGPMKGGAGGYGGYGGGSNYSRR